MGISLCKTLNSEEVPGVIIFFENHINVMGSFRGA